MSRHLVYHLDDFRTALTADAFRVFALLDELGALTEDFKFSLAQCCASALPGMVDHSAVLKLFVQDGLFQMFAGHESRLALFRALL